MSLVAQELSGQSLRAVGANRRGLAGALPRLKLSVFLNRAPLLISLKKSQRSPPYI